MPDDPDSTTGGVKPLPEPDGLTIWRWYLTGFHNKEDGNGINEINGTD